ncbi:urate hydroxylase PuuD [Halomonas halocynthiae]|uniref:urate hydroxylase PuuD n=1 Tax=Halomonas halocynthiae TaxID=176290 RepID=UPI000401C1F9|nr:urate hydroxylase PuuD [Halomonas halocynthiae]
MQAYLLEFANLLLRWLHVIAAIAWIGESIYFVMLDNGLRPPKAEEDKKKGVFGEMWAVHGGGFYHNQKYASAPEKLPSDLHWSFWKAYTTWLSGFGLFLLLYVSNSGIYLVNPNSDWAWVAGLSSWQASLVALAFLASGWIVYNELCKRISPNMERDGILSIAVAVMMIGVAYLSTHIFPGRAAFLLSGAVMATAMSANVFFWIIPGQRRMVKAMKAGEKPNPLDGKRGKQRSVHNTYFTLPVVLLMLSTHYSFIFSHELSWVLMVLFIFAGALIRQFFVLMHAGYIKPAYPAAGVALILIAIWVGAPSSTSSEEVTTLEGGAGETQSIEIKDGDMLSANEGIIQARCASCHAENPTHAAFAAAPAGIVLDSHDAIQRQITQIKDVVESGYMPLGNITGMTEGERNSIAQW